MPSKLDPHLATIEGWLATEPQLTALAIVGRLAEIDATFGVQQQSIVQRLLRAIRRSVADALTASTSVVTSPTPTVLPEAVDSSGHAGAYPPTSPPTVPARSPGSVVAASPSAG